MRRGRGFGVLCANVLMGVGALLLLYSGLWQIGLAPGSRVTLPPPVALAQLADTTATPQVITDQFIADVPPPAPLADTDPSTLSVAPVDQSAPAPPATAPVDAPAPTLAAATVAEAPAATDTPLALPDPNLPPPGYAVRLVIPSIDLDTQVEQGGIVPDADGNPIWETKPFVAVHYGDLTALVGAPGNAVIAGHVATLYWGNVFINLYKVNLGDPIQVWDDQGALHTYQVSSVRLVDPSDTSPMDPTPDPTLTLITCGGTFDPVTREFAQRLIVTGSLVPNGDGT